MGRRMKRTWRHDANAWADREATVRQTWDRVGQPTLDGIETDITAHSARSDELRGDVDCYQQWRVEHPEADYRLARLDRDIATLDRQIAPQAERPFGRAVGLDRGAEIAMPAPPQPD